MNVPLDWPLTIDVLFSLPARSHRCIPLVPAKPFRRANGFQCGSNPKAIRIQEQSNPKAIEKRPNEAIEKHLERSLVMQADPPFIVTFSIHLLCAAFRVSAFNSCFNHVCRCSILRNGRELNIKPSAKLIISKSNTNDSGWK